MADVHFPTAGLRALVTGTEMSMGDHRHRARSRHAATCTSVPKALTEMRTIAAGVDVDDHAACGRLALLSGLVAILRCFSGSRLPFAATVVRPG